MNPFHDFNYTSTLLSLLQTKPEFKNEEWIKNVIKEQDAEPNYRFVFHVKFEFEGQEIFAVGKSTEKKKTAKQKVAKATLIQMMRIMIKKNPVIKLEDYGLVMKDLDDHQLTDQFDSLSIRENGSTNKLNRINNHSRNSFDQTNNRSTNEFNSSRRQSISMLDSNNQQFKNTFNSNSNQSAYSFDSRQSTNRKESPENSDSLLKNSFRSKKSSFETNHFKDQINGDQLKTTSNSTKIIDAFCYLEENKNEIDSILNETNRDNPVDKIARICKKFKKLNRYFTTQDHEMQLLASATLYFEDLCLYRVFECTTASDQVALERVAKRLLDAIKSQL